MFDLLFKNISTNVSLNEEESALLKTFFIPKKLRKKQYLLQEGDPCKYTAFVEKGIVRSYTVDDKGTEHIMQFAPEGWWISDIYSFLTQEPSAYHIDCLEDAELLLITKSSYEEMLVKIPKMERHLRILIQNSLIGLQRRLVGSMSKSAEDNYTRLNELCPDLVQRVPQHMVASYLGITPETLSRIRKQIALRK